LRAVTDEIMAEIGRLSGQEYVNIYAKAAKEQLRAAEPDSQLSVRRAVTRGIV
jgi:1-acyl-sn-glycerol-3-phosphate acyltransferase